MTEEKQMIVDIVKLFTELDFICDTYDRFSITDKIQYIKDGIVQIELAAGSERLEQDVLRR